MEKKSWGSNRPDKIVVDASGLFDGPVVLLGWRRDIVVVVVDKWLSDVNDSGDERNDETSSRMRGMLYSRFEVWTDSDNAVVFVVGIHPRVTLSHERSMRHTCVYWRVLTYTLNADVHLQWRQACVSTECTVIFLVVFKYHGCIDSAKQGHKNLLSSSRFARRDFSVKSLHLRLLCTSSSVHFYLR